MEEDAIVKALLGELLDLRHMLGRQVGPELDTNGTLGGLDDQRILRIGRLRVHGETEAKRTRAKPSNERITEGLPLALEKRWVVVLVEGAPKTGRMIPPLWPF